MKATGAAAILQAARRRRARVAAAGRRPRHRRATASPRACSAGSDIRRRCAVELSRSSSDESTRASSANSSPSLSRKRRGARERGEAADARAVGQLERDTEVGDGGELVLEVEARVDGVAGDVVAAARATSSAIWPQKESRSGVAWFACRPKLSPPRVSTMRCTLRPVEVREEQRHVRQLLSSRSRTERVASASDRTRRSSRQRRSDGAGVHASIVVENARRRVQLRRKYEPAPCDSPLSDSARAGAPRRGGPGRPDRRLQRRLRRPTASPPATSCRRRRGLRARRGVLARPGAGRGDLRHRLN